MMALLLTWANAMVYPLSLQEAELPLWLRPFDVLVTSNKTASRPSRCRGPPWWTTSWPCTDRSALTRQDSGAQHELRAQLLAVQLWQALLSIITLLR